MKRLAFFALLLLCCLLAALPAQAEEYVNYQLYFNPDGGAKYHLDPNCASVSRQYLPLQGAFYRHQLDDEPYDAMTPCMYCGAPSSPFSASALSLQAVEPMAVPVYVNGVETEGYVRQTPIGMPGADDYLPLDNAMSTWQGSSYRQNGATGTLASAPATLESAWRVTCAREDLFAQEMQPTIIKWPKEVREMMAISADAKATTALREVFLSTSEGAIIALNLEDGTPTRSSLLVGYPLSSAVTLHPLGYPVLLTGQSSAWNTGGVGQLAAHYISAINGVTLRTAEKHFSSFSTSALIDRTTNTAIFLSDSGWLFTEQLDVRIIMTGTDATRFDFYPPESVTALVSASAITTEPVMSGSLLWVGSVSGQVICVDTTTMQPRWIAEGLYGVDGLTLREGASGLELWASTGRGESHLVCLDPYTGALRQDIILWLPQAGYEPTVMSAPMVGRNALEGLLYVCLTHSSGGGSSALCAVDAATGSIVWSLPMTGIATAIPVAVYAEDGSGWVIAVMEGEYTTTLLLVDGLTGELLDALTLTGTAPCQPAVYRDMLVITTCDTEESIIHGIRLTPAPLAPAHPDAAEDVINAFLTVWASNDQDAMQALCAPSWQAAQSNVPVALFTYRANRTVTAWSIDALDAATLTAEVRLCLDDHGRNRGVWYSATVTLVEEDGQLWLLPDFITTRTPADAPAEAQRITP